MGKLSLPPKTNRLLNRYFAIKAGSMSIACPYYQNLRKISRHPALSGKGKPREIEALIGKLLELKPRLKKISPNTLRLYLVMADIGIDCSGFVTNILNQYLQEKIGKNIYQIIPLKTLPFYRRLSFKLRPRTNLSALYLTSSPISKKIRLNKVRPGDLIKIGNNHVVIITTVWQEKKKVKKIEYAHSTSDYGNKHGVRKGLIIIRDKKLPLGKQIWKENYLGKNWTKIDYLSAKPSERGLRRLAILL